MLPLESGFVVLLPELGVVVPLPLSGDVGEVGLGVPVVPVGFGLVVPRVPAPVVLPVPFRVPLRAPVVERAPRRALVEAHGWPVEFSFAATDPSAAVLPVRFALPVALALPEYVPFGFVVLVVLFVSPVLAVPDAVVRPRRVRADARPVVADGTHGDAFGEAFAAPAGVPCVEPGCCVVF